MRCLAVALFCTALLGGCASPPDDPGGIWINQAAIDAASSGGKLREALAAHGPNLEWRIDSLRRRAVFSNGFELGEGQLIGERGANWQVLFYGDYRETLSLEDDELVQQASDAWPEQRFVRPDNPPASDGPAGSSFEQALYANYLGGTWQIRQGSGEGGQVRFHPDGRVEGLPRAEFYALCLAGDCATMSGEHDSLWLQQGNQGDTWLFELSGRRLQIFEAVNHAHPDEMPVYLPGPRRWLLRRQ
jgi:hypothetical protein